MSTTIERNIIKTKSGAAEESFVVRVNADGILSSQMLVGFMCSVSGAAALWYLTACSMLTVTQ